MCGLVSEALVVDMSGFSATSAILGYADRDIGARDSECTAVQGSWLRCICERIEGFRREVEVVKQRRS